MSAPHSACLPGVLRFEPLLKELVWGGRRLGTVLDKPLPTWAPYGESWELVDLPEDQSRVVGGELDGVTLGELRRGWPTELLGPAPLLDGRFPLLCKLIDAHQTLSVQVHPPSDAAARLGGGARPKTEAWYIVDRTPGAVLHIGLEDDVTPQLFQRALREGFVADLLHQVPVHPGEFYFLPAGTLHAIGAGILLAEVQQASDTTYRVFDWHRTGLDGKPRQLHLEQALASIDYAAHGPTSTPTPPSGNPGLVCEHFSMEEVKLRPGDTTVVTGEGPVIVMVVARQGSIGVAAGEHYQLLDLGTTCLVPARAATRVTLHADHAGTVLVIRPGTG